MFWHDDLRKGLTCALVHQAHCTYAHTFHRSSCVKVTIATHVAPLVSISLFIVLMDVFVWCDAMLPDNGRSCRADMKVQPQNDGQCQRAYGRGGERIAVEDQLVEVEGLLRR